MPDLSAGRVISGEREITREMLLNRALCAAGGFAALSVKPGDTLALVLRNDFPFFEASYAAQLLSRTRTCQRSHSPRWSSRMPIFCRKYCRSFPKA